MRRLVRPHAPIVIPALRLISNSSEINSVIKELCYNVEYDDFNTPSMHREKFIEVLKKDKKNINEKVNLVLIKKIGKIIKPNSINVNGQEIKNFLMQNF